MGRSLILGSHFISVQPATFNILWVGGWSLLSSRGEGGWVLFFYSGEGVFGVEVGNTSVGKGAGAERMMAAEGKGFLSEEEKKKEKEAADEEAAPPSEEEVEEFFSILRNMQMAIKCFEKNGGNIGNLLKGDDDDDDEEEDKITAIDSDADDVKRGGLQLDLNAVPEDCV